MKIICIILIVTPLILNSQSYHDELNTVLVQKFIDDVKENKWENIAENIVYPLERRYPVPNIDSKEEFLERYEELFDKNAIELISNSQPDDWFKAIESIILRDTNDKISVWLNYDYQLTHISNRSEKELKLISFLKDSIRNIIHKSLKDFSNIHNRLETWNYKFIEISEKTSSDSSILGYTVGAGNLAIWENYRSISQAPDYLLTSGQRTLDHRGKEFIKYKNVSVGLECHFRRNNHNDEGSFMLFQNGELVFDENVIYSGAR